MMSARYRLMAHLGALWVLCLSAGCSFDGPASSGHAISISEGVVRLVPLGPVFTPAPDDTLPWPGTITKMRYDARTGVIVAMDQLATLVASFTPDGRFLRQFGGSGAGPGEFRAVTDFDVGADGLVAVLDNANGRVNLFDSNGTFRSSFRVPLYRGMTFLANGRLAFFPSRHDAALDLYDLEGNRESIGLAADLPFTCTDRLEPGPECESKTPCAMCLLVALGPDRLALIDQFGVNVHLLDSTGRMLRTLHLASIDPMRTWQEQEYRRLEGFWREGKIAHKSFVADALALSETHIALLILPHRPDHNGRPLWVLNLDTGEVQQFSWDAPSIGNALAIGDDELYTLDLASGAVVRYRCDRGTARVARESGKETPIKGCLTDTDR